MKEKNHRNEKRNIIIVAIIAALSIGGGGYLYYKTAKNIIQNKEDLESTKIELTNTKLALTQSEEKVKDLSNRLGTEVYKNSLFSGQINEIIGTVGKLDKLSKTDKELLQKYSKIYFLNENYVPESLTVIPAEFVYEKDKELQIHTKVLPFLEDLLKAARNAGMDLKIISAYRSFGEQSVLKGAYTVNYGSDANTFSADQGYSEHQLGTTIDFTTASVGATFSGFSKTKEYEWLLQNAYKYGFTISYPKENTYYQFEPWHWRFVGRSLADQLHTEGQYFYDLDQRTIDTYLINIFD
ncbi:MAG: M15 family metallopeptidase [Candidatus Zambryskibacteria bacterium]